MDWLNYNHLHYFWMVAKEGSIARACVKLNLAQPTISGQLRQLEESIGEKLFVKAGRNLVLTDTGQVVYRYADEIFNTGRELLDVLRGRPGNRPIRFLVGVSDVMPKLMVFQSLQAVLRMPEPVQLVCYENDTEGLLQRLVNHGLDMILTDTPAVSTGRVRTFNHELGSCGVTFCAVPSLAVGMRRNFPASLDGAPFLLPVEGCALRRSLEQWFDAYKIRPAIVGEFQDTALMKVFGQSGAGVFAVASALETEARELYRVATVGRTDEISEHFYAVSVERRLKHPCVVAVSEAARQILAPSSKMKK
jgi:LysR family transcriptional regulator, transcriptional activator of nhaA